MTVPETKPVPVTVMTGAATPTDSTEGDTAEIVGAGFVTCRAIGVPDPLLIEPLSAITDSWAPLANWAAETVTVSCVPLTSVVGSATPPTSTVVVERKPVPLTVKVSDAEPAAAEVGLIEVTVGVGWVFPEFPPELLEDPPQPATSTDTPRPKAQNQHDFIRGSV